MERADAQRRRQRYATDPEYRRREVERVRKWKLKNEFREWQRKYNSEYYRKIGKEKMRKQYREKKKLQNPESRSSTRSAGRSKTTSDSEDGPRAHYAYHPEDALSLGPTIKVESHPDDDAFDTFFKSPRVQLKPESQTNVHKALDIEMEYKCKRCLQRSFTIDEATSHAKTHQPLSFKCGQCSSEFSELPLLLAHIDRAHSAKLDHHPSKGKENTTAVIKCPAPRASPLPILKPDRATRLKMANLVQPKSIILPWRNEAPVTQRTTPSETQQLLLQSIEEALEDFVDDAPPEPAVLSFSEEDSNIVLYSCHICPQLFSHEAAYEEHLTIHNVQVLVTCEYCSLMFLTEEDYENHLTSHFPTEGGDSPQVFYTAESTLSPAVQGKRKSRQNMSSAATWRSIDAAEVLGTNMSAINSLGPSMPSL